MPNLFRDHLPVDRRAFLVASGLSCVGAGLPVSPVALGAEATEVVGSGRRKIAKSAIMIWLSGGASHIDTWDMKPDAPLDYRGEFQPVATSVPGMELCEHLPHLARQAHHLAIVRSQGDFHRGTGDHHAGYYTNLTGHSPDPTFHRLLNARTPYPTDWPSMASVVAMKRPPHPSLPNAITLPQKEGAPEYTRPGQFAARLGIEYDPLFVDGSRDKPYDFVVPALALQGQTTREQMASRRELLDLIDQAQRQAERSPALVDYRKHQQKAFSLLTSRETKAAFDLGAEPDAVRQKYGATITGSSLLMARRLVGAGVPFVTVFWKEDKALDKLCKSGGGWDTHGNNFNCLKDRLLPEFDRAFAALLDDLHECGMLDETLVIVSSEMGRRPKIGDPRSGGVGGAGRDHWTHAMSTLLAGGGIRGGQVYGSTDKLAEYPKDNPVGAEHIARTVFHALGIDDLMAKDREGRPFHLMEEGRALTELFG